MKFLKYGLIVIGFIFIISGVGEGKPPTIIIGIVLLVGGSFTKIKSSVDEFSSSRATDALLKLKSLLDQGIISQDEYDNKSKKLKEKL
jgi:uncharacterized membrane protein